MVIVKYEVKYTRITVPAMIMFLGKQTKRRRFLYQKIITLLFLLISTNIFAASTPWYDFEIIDGTPILDVKIAGVPAKAALTTGSSTIFINVDFLNKHNIKYKKGKKVEITGLYGKPQKDRLIGGVEIEVLGLPFKLSGSGPDYGENDYDVQLGYSFFKAYVFQIDYAKSKIRALTHGSVDLNKVANVKTSFIENRSGLAMLTELENGKKLKLKVSTSLPTGLLLEHSFVKENGWIEKYNAKVVEDDPYHSELILPKLHVGPYILDDVVVTFPTESVISSISAAAGTAETGTRFQKRDDYKGIIGHDILKFFTITLDAKSPKMHLFAE